MAKATGPLHSDVAVNSFVVPKLCLANLIRGNESGIGREGGEAKQSFAVTHSQALLGNASCQAPLGESNWAE